MGNFPNEKEIPISDHISILSYFSRKKIFLKIKTKTMSALEHIPYEWNNIYFLLGFT